MGTRIPSMPSSNRLRISRSVADEKRDEKYRNPWRTAYVYLSFLQVLFWLMLIAYICLEIMRILKEPWWINASVISLVLLFGIGMFYHPALRLSLPKSVRSYIEYSSFSDNWNNSYHLMRKPETHKCPTGFTAADPISRSDQRPRGSRKKIDLV